MNAKEFNASPYLGWRFTTALLVEKLTTGEWKVTNKVIQERSLDFNEWETKDIQFISIRKDIEEALAESWMDTSQYLSTLGHDLFAEKTEEATYM